MKVTEIRSEAGLDALRPAWNELLKRSSSASAFLTGEWLTVWWRTYGTPGELYILTAADTDGVLCGIAPLRFRTVSRYGQKLDALTLLGDGSNDSDYLDFILAQGCEKAAFDAFAPRLKEELSRGIVLLLNEIPQESSTLPLLKALGEDSKALMTESEVPCGTVELPPSWDEYLMLLKPRFRTKARSILRMFESRPEVRFRFCDDLQTADRLLPALFDLHTRRWREDGKPGVFGWNLKRDFYRELSVVLLRSNALRLSWLEWNGHVLAVQYGLIHDRTYYHLQEGYEPRSQHWSAGAALRAWSIRELIHQGFREYDFLGGMGRHKTDWGANLKISKQVQIARTTYRNIAFCRGPEWDARAREAAVKIVPQPVLKVARAVMNGHSNGHGSAPAPRMRELLANCYVHTGMPAVFRGVRDRYRLAEGGLRRRIEPAARILYYHRINDDRDPFFPSMPVDQFEGQMRYVARHYNVVSLAELLDRLETGSTGTFLAITFDDGYEDNYRAAFPILERYGLTATIFLSTGAIDAREPLWFEQLAETCKKTDREYIDLEIDFPQRFWFRTEAERLSSNQRMFHVLRSLDDCVRRQYLPSILQQMNVPAERKAPMLTWDQIRYMKTRNIDFGGHTVTHPFLSKLSEEQLYWEVSECKRRIEEEAQCAVRYFAYPNGREEDFSEWNKRLLCQAGYEAAVTTIWGVNHPSTDRMELRRGGPWEETAAMFGSKLDWYQLVDG